MNAPPACTHSRHRSRHWSRAIPTLLLLGAALLRIEPGARAQNVIDYVADSTLFPALNNSSVRNNWSVSGFYPITGWAGNGSKADSSGNIVIYNVPCPFYIGAHVALNGNYNTYLGLFAPSQKYTLTGNSDSTYWNYYSANDGNTYGSTYINLQFQQLYTGDKAYIWHIWLDSRPSFYSTPSDQYALLNQTVSVSAAAAYGTMTYQWYAPNNAYLGSGSSFSFSATQNGAHKCVAYNNRLGSSYTSETYFYVNLVTTPVITSQPSAVISAAGGTATFSVGVSGYQLNYQWMKNGSNISGQNSSYIYLSNLQASDAANYSCRVWNGAGSVTSSAASLTLATLPVITSQPASITRPPGSNATFSVTATGLSLAYQWYKNSNVISGATSSSYSIPTVVLTDAGYYQAKVSNPAGTVWSSNAYLTTITPPTITVQPASLVTTQGLTASFWVAISGSPSIYQWRKLGDAGSQSLLSETFDSGNGNFSVATPVTFAGPWTYSGGSGSWREAGPTYRNLQTNLSKLTSPTLTASQSGPAFLRFSHRYNFDPGYDAGQVRYSVNGGAYAVLPASAFTANSYNGTVAAGVASTLAGGPCFNNSSTGGGSTYLLSEASLGNLNAGDTLSLQFLTAADASLGLPPESGLAGAVDTTGLTWTTSGNANWSSQTSVTHDGVDAAVAGTLLDNQSSTLQTTVTLASATTLTFWWKVSSEQNYDYLRFYIDGASQSGISGTVDWTQMSYPLSAGTHTLTWTYSTDVSYLIGSNAGWVDQITGLSASPTPSPYTNRWEIDSVAVSLNYTNVLNIAGATGTNYSIPNVQTNHQGQYSVVVTNVSGGATSVWASLSVRVPPTILTQPVSQLLAVGASTNLTVAAAGDTPLSYQWQFNNVAIPGATNTTLNIDNLRVSNSGAYRVLVSNWAGRATSSVAVVTVLVPPTIAVAPTSVFTNIGARVVLNPTITGGGTLAYQWFFKEQPLAGATNVSLTLDRAELSQAGTYWLRVRNAVSQTDSPRVWVVLSPLENQAVGWGDVSSGQTIFTAGWTNLVSLVAGNGHTLALRGDGAVLAAGATDSGQATVPTVSARAVAVAAGADHSLALGENCLVTAWGNNDQGQTNVPAGLSNVVAVAAGSAHSVALKADGTVVVWGGDDDAIRTVPAEAVNVQSISAAARYSVAVRSDGTAVFWGADLNDLNVLPESATNLVAVAAAPTHVLALRAEGAVVAWGDNTYGQTDVPAAASSATAVAANGYHSLAIQADGTVLAWGAGLPGAAEEWPNFGQSSVPESVTDATAIAAGQYFSVAALPAGPRFTETFPTRVGYLLSDTVTLEAKVAGALPLRYQWYRAGEAVAGATNATLRLPVLGPTAGAVYSVTISNLVASITGTVTLELDSPYTALQIVQQPQSAYVTRAANLVLGVGVEGTGPIRYQWQRNGSPITGATNDYYRPPTAQLTDSAAYAVVVNNDWETLTSETVQVYVLDPPAWPESYTNATLVAGQTLTLIADNTGSGPFDYQWYHDGQPIEGLNENRYSVGAVTWEEEGEYSVKITNPVGTITRTFYKLHVVSPPHFYLDLPDVASPRGVNAQFSFAVGGEPPLTYIWYQNNILMPDEFRTNMIVQNVAYAHTNYAWKVVVTNSMGAITSRVAHLTIIEPPTILTQPSSLVVEPNTEARFSVTCGGTLPLYYQWFLNGAPVVGGTNSTLIIPSVTSARQGTYEVQVTNPAGTATSTAATLGASVAPVALGASTVRTNVAPGSVFELTARVAGLGPFNFQWLLNGVAITGQTNLTLVVSNTPPEAAGWYSFTVSNAYGSDTLAMASGAEVRVVDLPFIESGPDDVLAILGHAATFSVTVRGTNRFSYQWIKDGDPIAGATDSSYTLPSPTLPDVGSYSVAVANSEGTTWSSTASLTFAKLPRIVRHPASATVGPGGSAQFSIEVESALPVSYQWRQDGSDLPDETNATFSITLPARVVSWDRSYSVLVTSDVGRVSSLGGLLTVQRTPEILLRHSRLITQGIPLHPGWNAIYLTVQPVSNRVDEVFAGLPWTSVWMWRDRENSIQFIQEMTEAEWNGPDWLVNFQTNRVESFQNNLHRLFVNQAYLVHIDGTSDVYLEVQGEPSLDVKSWRPDSYNLTGVPVERGLEPTAADYFRYSPAHYDSATGQIKPVYRLEPDGRWHLLTNSDPIEAGVAYWFYVRGGSSYVGPIEVGLSYGRGLLFTRDVESLDLSIRNRTDAQRRIWITAHPLYAGGLPLMIREVNDQGVNRLEMPPAYVVDVPAGSSRTVSLAADRLRTDANGFESVMLVSDDYGLAIQLPVLVEHVAAVSASGGQILPNVVGLWVGQATLDAISEVNSVTAITNRIRFTNDLGQITNVVTITYTNTPSELPTPVASGLSQRIIFHNDSNSVTRLLSEVFQLRRADVVTNDVDGYKAVQTPGQPVLVTRRARLADFQGTRLRDGELVGRRISSPTFTFGGDGATNNYVECSGQFGPGRTLTVTFGLAADHPLNPFKHRYHPDHDNLSPNFQIYQEEAYGVIREVTLVFDAVSSGVTPAAGYNELRGEYRERIRGLHRNPIAASGRFILQRFNTVGVLNPEN